MLDRDRREGGDPRPHGIDEGWRDLVRRGELADEQGVAASQVDESHPRLEIEGWVQPAGQGLGGRAVERVDLDERDLRQRLEGQWRARGDHERDAAGEQGQDVERAAVAPVGILHDQHSVRQVGGDVCGDVGGAACERPRQGVGEWVVGQAAQRLQRLAEDERCRRAAPAGRASTCRCRPGRARPRSCHRRAVSVSARASRPPAPQRRGYTQVGTDWGGGRVVDVRTVAGSGRRAPTDEGVGGCGMGSDATITTAVRRRVVEVSTIMLGLLVSVLPLASTSRVEASGEAGNAAPARRPPVARRRRGHPSWHGWGRRNRGPIRTVGASGDGGRSTLTESEVRAWRRTGTAGQPDRHVHRPRHSRHPHRDGGATAPPSRSRPRKAGGSCPRHLPVERSLHRSTA